MKKIISKLPPCSLCKEAINTVGAPGANANNDKKYFTFEGRQYYAVYNAPGYIGLMIFIGDGVSVPEYQFPELWMYYHYQKDFLRVKDQKSSK